MKRSIHSIESDWPEAQDQLERILIKGGPRPSDYEQLNAGLAMIHTGVLSGNIPADDVRRYFHALAKQLGLTTCQGYSYLKPRGYAGDFEIIDRIYRRHVSPDSAVARWDQFAHTHPALEAVRNRKQFFIDTVCDDVAHTPFREFRILDLGSGPGRDVAELLQAVGTHDVRIDCVDQDPAALEYAAGLCSAHRSRLTFSPANVLRYRPVREYDLIWSAGLFDYLSERLFALLIKRLLPSVKPGGRMIIGNFSPANASRAYMELAGDWVLNYRSEEELLRIAIASGVPVRCIEVGREPAGVNLFLTITVDP